ncbi:hypothetical protein Tsubulata_002688 [Turnera subulata]|uniref:Uncharacterized protein n=1 Tax=Turnera subulata TaxID=218843 RepID=A0A9Q0F5N4_9ROSI|nr:hypothetical protein Tsubulata_002688 [Turnera subulata]
MEKVHEELDEAKAEIEKLKEDLRCKAALSENLKRVHNEKLIQIEEASKTIEKQAQELNEKLQEITAAKERSEDLQCRLNEKEAIIRRLSTANDKLRVDCSLKDRKWEEEKRNLVLALDEANEKNLDLEQKIHVFRAEIEGLKGLLSTSQKKCMEAEKKAKAPGELRERDDMLLKLEEEYGKVENQLKWKKEQFKHLEEAHVKLRDQFKESKKEWEREKSTMIDEICSLQTSLDSQTRISEDLQSRLKICNQALAHEETRRKYLEVEVSEFKVRFDNIFTECQDAKSQLECLATKRDNEIAALRHSLGTKEIFYKEIEHRAGKLEDENRDLLASLKELREAQIKEMGCSSSLSKLRNKLKNLEQIHKDCSVNLRAKEAGWNSQLEKLSGELTDYNSAVEDKERTVQDLQMELENCYCAIMQLKLQSEEAAIMLLVLQSGIADARLKLRDVGAQMSLHQKGRDEEVSFLTGQLEMKNTALEKARREIEEEHEKLVSLLKGQESLDTIKEQQLLTEKELERYKEMLEDSSRRQLHFKEQAEQVENDMKEKIRALRDSLDLFNAELLLEREKAASLSRRVDSLNPIDEKWQLMQEDFRRCNQVLGELSRRQLLLEEQALQIESNSSERLTEVCDALEKEWDEQCEKVASLSKRVESLGLVEEQKLHLQSEIERYKELLEESSKKALQVETDLQETLGEVSNALDSATSELAEERRKTASLLTRVESFEHIEEKQLLMQKKLERYKEMLEQSSSRQLCLEKQASMKENNWKEKLKEVNDALDRLNSEFAAKLSEGHAVEFELWLWKCIAQRLKDDLEESRALRRELEASLLAQVKVEETIKKEKESLIQTIEVKSSRIDDLQRQIECIEKEVETTESTAAHCARMETMIESERESLHIAMTEKDKTLSNLQREIGWLEQESLRREFESLLFAQIRTEKEVEHEKEDLIHVIEEKDRRIDDFLQFAKLLEEKFNSSLATFSLELDEKKAEINLVQEAWEKIAAAEILAQHEIEEKKLMIVELEDNIISIQKELQSQQKLSSYSYEKAMEIEAELEAKHLEMKELTTLMETKLRTSEALVGDLKNEKKILVEDIMKLSAERKDLLGFIEGLGTRINQLFGEDMQLVGSLERMVQSFENDGFDLNTVADNEILVKENRNPILSPSTRKFEGPIVERFPFRELN